LKEERGNAFREVREKELKIGELGFKLQNQVYCVNCGVGKTPGQGLGAKGAPGLDVVALDDEDCPKNDDGAVVGLARVKSREMAKTGDNWAHRPKIDKQIVNDKDRAWYFKKWAALEEGNKQASFYRDIGKNF
jgi:hypothetical protein